MIEIILIPKNTFENVVFARLPGPLNKTKKKKKKLNILPHMLIIFCVDRLINIQSIYRLCISGICHTTSEYHPVEVQFGWLSFRKDAKSN